MIVGTSEATINDATNKSRPFLYLSDADWNVVRGLAARIDMSVPLYIAKLINVEAARLNLLGGFYL